MKRKIKYVILFAAIFSTMNMVGAYGTEKISCDVDIMMGGEICAHEMVDVTDENGNGQMDLDDALKTVSGQKEKEYKSEESEYGISLVNLWGDESGAFGYYLNDSPASSLSDAIKDGDHISCFVYSDKENFSDVYTYFSERNVEGKKNQEATVTLMQSSYDKDWNVVTKPMSGIKLYEGDQQIAVTDQDGKASIQADGGTHVIISKGDGIVPAVCIISCKGGGSLPWIIAVAVVLAIGAVAAAMRKKKAE